MRFAVGQAFASVLDGRQAVIAEIRDDGRAGLLRLLDNGQVQWVLWAQFLNSEKWIPIGMKEAANWGAECATYTTKEKLKIAAGAVCALVIVGWLAVFWLAAISAR